MSELDLLAAKMNAEFEEAECFELVVEWGAGAPTETFHYPGDEGTDLILLQLDLLLYKSSYLRPHQAKLLFKDLEKRNKALCLKIISFCNIVIVSLSFKHQESRSDCMIYITFKVSNLCVVPSNLLMSKRTSAVLLVFCFHCLFYFSAYCPIP